MIVAGVDEAGRGALAGPVVACCVVFRSSFNDYSYLEDSKALTVKQRDQIFRHMFDSIVLGVGIVSHREIDRINILNATLLAMSKSIRRCRAVFDHVIVDGNSVPTWGGSCESIVKADQMVDQVKAASICAKVLRDRMMDKYHNIYSNYGFIKNKGYGTEAHYEDIFNYGVSLIHRKSFNLNRQLTLF